MPVTSSTSDLASSVSRLSLKTGTGAKGKPSKVEQAPVADSWEDEDLSSSGSDTETEATSPNRDVKPSLDDSMDPGTQAPPPTPISPTYNNAVVSTPFSPSTSTYPASSQSDGTAREMKRPEKTDAVARRMIAAGLGLRVQRTEEEKAYDRAVREKERKRREQEREQEKRRQEEAEKAKQSIWDD